MHVLIRSVGILAVALAGLLSTQAATASAATFRGQINDPVEHPADRSRDITRIASTFDNTTGRWAVDVTFAAPPTVATSARLYLSLWPPKTQCLGAGGLGMQLESASPFARYTQTCRRGTPQTIQRALTDRVLTLQVTDPTAIGLTPHELGQARLSHHRVYDALPATRMFAATAAATLRVGPSTRLRLSRTGSIRLPLTGVSERASASMRLTAHGRVLARRTLTAKPGLPGLRLQLPAAARRHVSADGTKATLTTKLTDLAGKKRTITQTITVLAGAVAARATAAALPPVNSGCGDDGPTVSDVTPTLRLTSATLRLRDSGRVRVFVRGTQTAAMTVKIVQVGGKRVGGTSAGGYTCTTPGSSVVALALGAYGRKLVRRHGRLAVKITFRLVNGSGFRNTRVLSGVIKPE